MVPIKEMPSKEFVFKVPSGHQYTIREQNGADEDLLSNQQDAQDLRNIAKFIASIVIDTDFTPTRKLTLNDVNHMPILDKYCILINSRIFSIGSDLSFTYDWKENGGPVDYTQDLKEFLFDYEQVPTEEEMEAKPEAIPFYPQGSNIKGLEVLLGSGKKIKFDLFNGLSESYIMKLPKDNITRNQELIARNLCLEVNGTWERVSSFELFSVKDMAQIRKAVSAYDPVFTGNTEIPHPSIKDLTAVINIMAVPGFFFPEEI